MPQVIPFIIAAAESAWVVVSSFVVAQISAITWASVGNLLLNTAIGLGLGALSGLIAGGPKTKAQKQVIRQAVAPRRRAYGRVKVGGVYYFLRNRTVGSGDFYLFEGIMLLSGESDAYEAHWLGEDEVTVDVDGNITAPPHLVKSGSPSSWVQIYKRHGLNSSLVHSQLVTAFPEIWTADHHLNGITQVLVTLLAPDSAQFSTVYPGGLPDYNATLRASKVWDPRA